MGMAEIAFAVTFVLVGAIVLWSLFEGEVAGRVESRSVAGDGVKVSVVRSRPETPCVPPGVRLQFRQMTALQGRPLSRDEALAIADALEHGATLVGEEGGRDGLV